MRTTLDLREDLVKDVMRIRKWRSKTEAIEAALEKFIQEDKLKSLMALRGKLKIRNNWKKLREMELHEA